MGCCCPPLFGGRSCPAVGRLRGWEKNLPGRLLGALPKRTWGKRLPRLGQDVLLRRWRQVEAKSPATRRRWQWTWGGDGSLFRKSGRQLGWVGPGWSGQEPRVRWGIDGLRLLVVMGEGKRIVPGDCAVRRPDPIGPGRPCRHTLTWRRVMLDRTWAAWHRRCRRLPPPLLLADRWCGESGLMRHVAPCQQGLLVVEGQTSSVVQWPDGRQITGQDVLSGTDWPWRESVQVPGMRDARLPATSPTDGRVTVVVVGPPGRDRYDLRCRETARSGPRLIRAWRRRSGIGQSFRTLKHLLATEARQVQSEEAYCGHVRRIGDMEECYMRARTAGNVLYAPD